MNLKQIRLSMARELGIDEDDIVSIQQMIVDGISFIRYQLTPEGKEKRREISKHLALKDYAKGIISAEQIIELFKTEQPESTEQLEQIINPEVKELKQDILRLKELLRQEIDTSRHWEEKSQINYKLILKLLK